MTIDEARSLKLPRSKFGAACRRVMLRPPNPGASNSVISPASAEVTVNANAAAIMCRMKLLIDRSCECAAPLRLPEPRLARSQHVPVVERLGGTRVHRVDPAEARDLVGRDLHWRFEHVPRHLLTARRGGERAGVRVVTFVVGQ